MDNRVEWIWYWVQTRIAIKGQAVVDFILEFTSSDSFLSKKNSDEVKCNVLTWTMFVDGSMNQDGSGIGIFLESLKHDKILRAFKLDFSVSDNEAKYKALLIELQLENDLDIKSIQFFYDSKLVSS